MRSRLLLSAWLLAVGSVQAGGQESERKVQAFNGAPVGITAPYAVGGPAKNDASLPALVQGEGRKEPIVAGVLSWVVPGLGSFYAGHSKHGWTHLAVAGASLVIMVVGVSDCVGDDFYSDCDTGLGFAAVGYLGYVVNAIWGIVSAVGDANAANRGASAPGRVVGELYLAPEVRAVRTAAPVEGIPAVPQRTEVRLLTWRF